MRRVPRGGAAPDALAGLWILPMDNPMMRLLHAGIPLESLGKYWMRIIQCFPIWPDALADGLAGSAYNQRIITASCAEDVTSSAVKRQSNASQNDTYAVMRCERSARAAPDALADGLAGSWHLFHLYARYVAILARMAAYIGVNGGAPRGRLMRSTRQPLAVGLDALARWRHALATIRVSPRVMLALWHGVMPTQARR